MYGPNFNLVRLSKMSKQHHKPAMISNYSGSGGCGATSTNEIQFMVDFIEQEAEEKAEEINIRTEEEFKLQKKMYVQQEKLIINKEFFKREKLAGTQYKTERSSIINKARLALLREQQEHLSRLLEETKQNLAKISADEYRYRALMMSLILEGLLILIEPVITIRVRQSDKELAQALIPVILKKYKEKTGTDKVKITIDENNFLDETSTGGVELFARNGKIKVTNTLEERLEIVSTKLLPQIRKIMFTVNIFTDFFA